MILVYTFFNWDGIGVYTFFCDMDGIGIKNGSWDGTLMCPVIPALPVWDRDRVHQHVNTI